VKLFTTQRKHHNRVDAVRLRWHRALTAALRMFGWTGNLYRRRADRPSSQKIKGMIQVGWAPILRHGRLVEAKRMDLHREILGPSICAAIIAHVEAAGAGLNPVVREAIDKLCPAQRKRSQITQ
jgi:hypothetical protein